MSWEADVDRKPHKDWRQVPMFFARSEPGSVVAAYELDVWDQIKCDARPLNNGRCQWSTFVKGDYENTQFDCGETDSLESAQLAAEDALRALLTAALDELGSGV
jgi:hypothetical protein